MPKAGGVNGLPVHRIEIPEGSSADVYEHGATLTSWKSNHGEVSETARRCIQTNGGSADGFSKAKPPSNQMHIDGFYLRDVCLRLGLSQQCRSFLLLQELLFLSSLAKFEPPSAIR